MQEVPSSYKRTSGGESESSFHDDVHKMHRTVHALYSSKNHGSRRDRSRETAWAFTSPSTVVPESRPGDVSRRVQGHVAAIHAE